MPWTADSCPASLSQQLISHLSISEFQAFSYKALPPSQPWKSTGPQLMNRCCCSTTSSLGLWKQSSRALDFLWQVVRRLMFISLPLALPQEPCWMAFASRSWHSMTRSHHWTSKNSEHESCPWWGELFWKERVYLSRAQALTKWQGQAPYNCPLQHFSQTTLKHLYCSVLVTTLEGELALFSPYICFSHYDESMFNFPVAVRKKTRDYLCLKSVFIPELHCITAHSKQPVLLLP